MVDAESAMELSPDVPVDAGAREVTRNDGLAEDGLAFDGGRIIAVVGDPDEGVAQAERADNLRRAGKERDDAQVILLEHGGVVMLRGYFLFPLARLSFTLNLTILLTKSYGIDLSSGN